MKEQPTGLPQAEQPQGWQTQLLLTAGVLLTLLAALLLAQIDSLQQRAAQPSPRLPVVDVAATLAAGELALVPLPTQTPTPTTTPAATATAPGHSPPTATGASSVAGCAAAPPDWQPYVTQPGDSLTALALRSGTTVSAIAQANCLDGGALLPGLRIFLPAQAPTAVTCGPPAWWTRYWVRRGDTLFGLARQRGTTVFAIMQANCLDSSYLMAGRQIYLPPQRALPAATAVPTATPLPSATATLPPPTAAPSATIAPTVAPTVAPTATPTPLPPSATPPPTDTPAPPTPTVTPIGVLGTPTPTAAPPTPEPPTAEPPTPEPPTPTAEPPTPEPPTAEPPTPEPPTPAPTGEPTP